MVLRRVRRALALTTIFVALVSVPAAQAVADGVGGDPGTGTETTSTTLGSAPATDPTTAPAADPTTTTTTTDPSSTTTTTAPADSDTATTSSSTTTTTGPTLSTTSSTRPSSTGGSGHTTTTTRPSSASAPTTPASTATTAPVSSPAGAVVVDPAGDSGGGAAAADPSGGSARTVHPAPTRTDHKDSAGSDHAAEGVAPANWFDPSSVGGLLGAGTDPTSAPAGAATADAPPAGLEAALAGQDHRSSSSVILLGVSLLILLGLAGGVAVRWWAGRSDRYWPA